MLHSELILSDYRTLGFSDPWINGPSDYRPIIHLTTCYLRVRSSIFFLIFPQAWYIAWMFTDLESPNPRPRRYIFKTETRTRRSIFQTLETEMRRDVQPSRPRQDRDVPKNFETETLKTKTTSLTLATWLTLLGICIDTLLSVTDMGVTHSNIYGTVRKLFWLAQPAGAEKYGLSATSNAQT